MIAPLEKTVVGDGQRDITPPATTPCGPPRLRQEVDKTLTRAIKALELDRSNRQKEHFGAQDVSNARREGLIGNIEKQLQQKQAAEVLSTVRWSVR